MEHDRNQTILRRSYLALAGASLVGLAGCQENGELEVPARFEVGSLAAPETAVEGERITVEADVTNVGDQEGSTIVEVRRDGDEILAREVELDAGASTTVTVDDQPPEAGEVEIEVDTGDETESTTIVVESSESAAFSVQSLEAPSTGTVGETVVIRAAVGNDADDPGTATVSLFVDGEAVDEEAVPLESGQEEIVRFPHAFESAGTTDVGVGVTERGAASGEITIEEREAATFEVSSVDNPDTAIAGDEVHVRATVENVGQLEGESAVVLLVDDDAEAEATVDLEPDERTRVRLSAEIGDAGDRELIVRTDDDEASRTLQVREPQPSLFELTEVAGPTEVSEAVTTRVTTVVTNLGEESDGATLSLFVDEDRVDEREIELESGEETTVTLEWDTGDLGVYEYVVETPDDTASNEFEVVEAQGAFAAAEAAREELASMAAAIAETIDDDFVGGQGTIVASPWDGLADDSKWVRDKLEEAETGLEEFEGDEDELADEIDALRDARAVLDSLGLATDRAAEAYTYHAEVRGRLDDDPGVGAIEELEEPLLEAGEELEAARGHVADAESGLADLADDWLEEFDGEVDADRGVESATERLDAALDEFGTHQDDAWQSVAGIPLGDARDALATAVDRCLEEIDEEFLHNPRSGVSVSIDDVEEHVETADERLPLAEAVLGKGDVGGSDAGVAHENLGHVRDALDDLTSSMTAGESAFNEVTDAAALVTIDAYDDAFAAVDSGATDLRRATSYFDSATDALDEVDADWLDEFDDRVDADGVRVVFERFEEALDAAGVLIDGIDRLLDVSGYVSDANEAYEDENYDRAASRFRSAEDVADDAYQLLTDGKSGVPIELELMIEEGECRARHIRDALSLLADASDLAADGDEDGAAEKADEALETANATCP